MHPHFPIVALSLFVAEVVVVARFDLVAHNCPCLPRLLSVIEIRLALFATAQSTCLDLLIGVPSPFEIPTEHSWTVPGRPTDSAKGWL